MKRYPGIFILLITTFFHTGCASSSPVSSSPSPVSIPEPTSSTPATTLRSAVFWKITPTSQTQAYSSLVTTVITEESPSTPRRDSLTTEALYSISSMRRSDSLSFSGLITNFTVKGGTPDILELQPTFPIPFTGSVTSHNITIQRSDSPASNSNSCSNGFQAPLRTVQRNLFSLPLEMTYQQTWTDSVSSSLCNGALPVTITTIRTFHVVGESEIEGSLALLIDENERTFSRGEGSQGQHQILVETQGSTNGRIYVNRNSGQLLAANLTTKSSVSIQSSGRIQHFFQNSTETIRQLRN
jgi:hypothetical protein